MYKDVLFDLRKELVIKTCVHSKGIARGVIDMNINNSSVGKNFLGIKQS